MREALQFSRKGARRNSETLLLLLLVAVCLVLVVTYVRGRSRRPLAQPEFKQLMEDRHSRASSVCAAFPSLSKSDPMHRMHYYTYLMEDLRLLWCPVYKAASTSFVHFIMRQKGLGDDDIRDLELFFGSHQPTVQLRALVPEFTKAKYEKVAPTAAKIIFVRHPLTRIVSAYRDKLERFNRKYYSEFGWAMVSKYRERALKRLPESAFRRDRDQDGILVEMPTFWEFAQSIVDAAAANDVFAMDEHWWPVYVACKTCEVKYDYVVKVEHLRQELPLAIQQLGFVHGIQNLKWENEMGGDSSEVAHEYLSVLTSAEREALIKVYAPDFQMFDYQPDNLSDQ